MIRYVVVVAWALALIGLARVESARAQPCSPGLSAEFAADPLDFAPSAVNAFIDFNDGTGFKTYACGSFRTAGGVPANTVARWNGMEWQAVGDAPAGTGKCFAIFNNTLYMGGSFGGGDLGVACIYRWSGSAWLPMLDGPRGASVNAMTVWNDGMGNALYAVGNFSRVGSGATVRAVVKWNGSAWTQLGVGLPPNGLLNATAVIGYDDGMGPALYVGGQFSALSNGVLVKWDRSNWVTSGGPSTSLGSTLTAFHVYADNQGSALWAALAPQSASPILYRYGSSRFWQQINAPTVEFFAQANALTSYNDGSGNALYVAGQFSISAAGGLARSIAKYNGLTWSRVGVEGSDIIGPVTALGVRTGTRVGLLAGGVGQIGSQRFGSVALWNGAAWAGLGSGLTNPWVQRIEFVPSASGDVLHALGQFGGTRWPTGSTFNHAARWNGTRWEALGVGVNGARLSTVIGDKLYAASSTLTIPGDPTVGTIAEWDGTTWSHVVGPPQVRPSAMCTFDEGSGPQLCVAGPLSVGSPAVYVRRNNAWFALGGTFAFSASITAIKQLRDGSLYVLGSPLEGNLGIPNARSLARWSGTQWTVLPAGPQGFLNDIEVFDGAIWIAGAINFFDEQNRFRSATLAKFDGSSWQYPTADRSGTCTSLAVWNDGTGDAMYFAGEFADSPSGIVNLARSRAGRVEPFAGGTNASISSLRVHDGSLYAAGSFTRVGTSDSPGVARWIGCPLCVADVDDGRGGGIRDGGVTIDDLLYYLALYASGNRRADIDDGTGTGTPDGGVTMEDLIYYLGRYEAGC